MSKHHIPAGKTDDGISKKGHLHASAHIPLRDITAIVFLVPQVLYGLLIYTNYYSMHRLLIAQLLYKGLERRVLFIEYLGGARSLFYPVQAKVAIVHTQAAKKQPYTNKYRCKIYRRAQHLVSWPFAYGWRNS